MVFTESDYAELLGMYLGDGHIARMGRTHRLRIFLDSKYGGIIDDCEALLCRCFPGNRVGRQPSRDANMTIVGVYSGHLTCLFPQHGPGPKHARPLALESWQQEIIEANPWPLLRGLIRTDGCSFVNKTGNYAYPSYQFSNRSTVIKDLFIEACGRVGVRCRCNLNQARQLWDVRINQRASVALLDAHVGVKK